MNSMIRRSSPNPSPRVSRSRDELQFNLRDFSGPLDLLLSLLEEKKMGITEVALSEVTEQYIAYLDTLGQERERELADFLVIATRLLLLKSRSLLPHLFPEEEEAAGSLEEQLRLYQRFQEASKEVNRRWDNPARSFFRFEPPRRSEVSSMPDNLSLAILHASMVQLIDRLAPPKPLPKTSIDRTVSIKEKIMEIHRLLTQKKRASFFSLLSDAGNKTEVIVGFLALLELVKQREIGLSQSGTFGDILIQKV